MTFFLSLVYLPVSSKHSGCFANVGMCSSRLPVMFQMMQNSVGKVLGMGLILHATGLYFFFAIGT